MPEEARSILRHQKDHRYGWGYSLNPYRGCSHGCRYCYVRGYPAPVPNGASTIEGPRLRDPQEWGSWVTPKLNAPEMLWNQRHRLHNESVFISSATDPYQTIEREFRLTRKCLQVLLACPTTKVIIHTRSPMILQDLELLRAFGPRLSVGFSMPTDDDRVRRVIEPLAPPIASRWAAIERLARGGIRVGISAAPLLPVNDMAAFANQARDHGAQSAWAGGLRLLKNDPFYGVLAEQRWLYILDSSYSKRMGQAFRDALGDHSHRPRPESLVPEPVWANRSNELHAVPGLHPQGRSPQAPRKVSFVRPGHGSCGPSFPSFRHARQSVHQPGLFEEAS